MLVFFRLDCSVTSGFKVEGVASAVPEYVEVEVSDGVEVAVLGFWLKILQEIGKARIINTRTVMKENLETLPRIVLQPPENVLLVIQSNLLYPESGYF